MTMQVFTDSTPNAVTIAIWLDDTKVAADGTTPDEAWVEWYPFPGKPAAFVGSNNAWSNQCKQEARLLARATLAARRKAARKATDLSAPETAADTGTS